MQTIINCNIFQEKYALHDKIYDMYCAQISFITDFSIKDGIKDGWHIDMCEINL